MYYLPQYVTAQASDIERCEEKICHVKITEDGFVPRKLIVKIGTTVIWTNLDDGRHTVTSGLPGQIELPLKSLLLEKDSSYKFTFDYAGKYQGSYKYFDQVTRTMRGEIAVEPETKPSVEEKPQEIETIRIDFKDPKSGVRSLSYSAGSVNSVGIHPDSPNLIILLESAGRGVLDISLDRNLIDARKENGKDAPFQILIDGRDGFYEEISATPAERTLSVVVPSNTKQIEIIGTISYIKSAITAIKEADEFIVEYKNRDMVVTDAENELNEAKNAFDKGLYANAETFANNAKTIASNTGNAALIASKAINAVDADIKENDVNGFDVSNAKQLFNLAQQAYAEGSYDKALNLAQQASTIVLEVRNATKTSDIPAQVKESEVRNTPVNAFDQTYVIAAVIGASVAAVGAVVFTRFRSKDLGKSDNLNSSLTTERRIDLNRIFAEKPYLRDDDKEAIRYLVEKGGVAYETEIKEKFNMPKTTVWRLVRRLERDGLVEVKKTNGHNIIRIKEEFATDGRDSMSK
jgi:uncharacterized membrane protein/plastocyanin